MADRSGVPHGLTPELIARYAVAGPRYTSYPTAVEFTPSFTERDWRAAWAGDASAPDDPLALYVHIPFCHSLCYFCACHKVILPKRGTRVAEYLEALEREIGAYGELLGRERPIEQLHWGGGSPNYLDEAETERLFERLSSAFPRRAPEADISIEIDPRTTTRSKLELLRRLGFNRVSLGVQDLDPAVQELINRIQPYEMTRDSVVEARRIGFSSINIDLIYGLPGQELARFGATIDKVIGLRPDRIALYGYAHVTWLKKVQKVLEHAHIPEPAERIELFLCGVERLLAAGYVAVGMDHFALPEDSLVTARRAGKLNRNFMGYTTHRGARVLGLGCSAISSLPAAFAQNEKDLAKYQAVIADGALPIERGLGLTADDMRRAELIHHILCDGAIDIRLLEREWGIDFWPEFDDAREPVAALAQDGLLVISADRIELTQLGRYFMRNVAMVFDAHLAKHAARKVFSQAV